MRNRLKLLLVCVLAVMIVAALIPLASAEDAADAQTLLATLSGVSPTISEDGTHIVLPTLDEEGYEITLYGSSNESVIALDGTVYTPLVDTKVELMYKVTSINDESDSAVGLAADCSITVPGRYSAADGDNAEPQVLPKLREWKGLNGTVSVTEASRIIIGDSEHYATAELVAEYIAGVGSLGLEIVEGASPSAGDILFVTSDEVELGEEGYTVELGEYITVAAPTAKGLLYGGTTVAQMLSLYDGGELPCGLIRDYPEYEVRSLLLDVARAYIPLDYVEEITKYMAYFKLNEIRLHINDNGGEQSYAFRLESKLYPEINSNLPADEVYSQEDYRAFQKNALKYGVSVITEIDSPGHSGFVHLYDPSLMADGSHLDLGDGYDAAVAFMKSLIDEMVDGSDPVIAADRLHIGMDEYSLDHGAFLSYMEEMTDYVASKGLAPAVWGATKSADFADGMPRANESTVVHCWSQVEASFADILNNGYSIVNNSGTQLYIVPGGFSTYFADRLDIASLYESWEAYNILSTTVSAAHPGLLGIEASLWNDVYCGMSRYDLFDRARDQIALISEKGWYGARPDGADGESFAARAESLDSVPGVNPMRAVEAAADGTVINTDFSSEDGITLAGATLSDGVLSLDGTGYISPPYAAVGYPWTLSFSICYTSDTAESAPFLDGDEGTLYLNYQGTGKLAYARESEVYILDYALCDGVWLDITLTCDGDLTRLYVNEVFVAEGRYAEEDTTNMRSSTFVLPTERIGCGVVGEVDNLVILDRALSHDVMTGADIIDYGNVALGKDVTLSGTETGVACTPEMAVDGVETASERISLNQEDDAWALIDLGAVYTLDRIEIVWFRRPNQYQFLVSVDGDTWIKAFEDLECVTMVTGTDNTGSLDGIKARYVKYQQLEMFVANAEKNYRYSGSFSEIKVFGYNTGGNTILTDARTILDGTERTDENAEYLDRLALSVALVETIVESGSIDDISTALRLLSLETARLESGDVSVAYTDTSAFGDALASKRASDIYTSESYADYERAYGVALSAYILGDTAEQTAAYAAQELTAAEAALRIGVTVETNITLNKPNYKDLSTLVDGDEGTYISTSAIQAVGDYFIFRFNSEISLSSVDVICNSNSVRISYANLYVSYDGETFVPVTDSTGAAVIFGNTKTENKVVLTEPLGVKAIKIELCEIPDERGLAICEVYLNNLSLDTSALDDELAIEPDQKDYSVDSFADYTAAREAALAVRGAMSSTQDEISAALSSLTVARSALVEEADITVESSFAWKSGYNDGAALFDGITDGTAGTYMRSTSSAQAVGDYITLTFKTARDISSVDIICGANALRLAKSYLLVSYDGESFEYVTTSDGEYAVFGDAKANKTLIFTEPVHIKALRIEVCEAQSRGLALYEIELNTYTVNTGELDAAASEEICSADYTDESLAEYNAALETVNAVLSSVSSTQTEIDAALAALSSAKEALAPSLAFSGVYLYLNEDINVVYTLDIADSVSDVYMEFSFRGKTYTVTDAALMSDGRYSIPFNGVMPYYMGEQIDATLYGTKDGALTSVSYNGMSVSKYCDMAVELNPTDTSLITLVSDLLSYGAAAQAYTGYNDDALVTEGVSWLAPSDYVTPESILSMDGVNGTEAVWTGVGLNLANEMNMYFSFTAEQTEGLTVTVSVGDREAVYDVSELTPGADGKYRIYYRKILASEFSDAVNAVFKLDGQTVGATLTYSVDSYVVYMENNTDENLAALVRSIACYGKSARTYGEG